MKPDQKAIYFITADGSAAARQSPHLELFRKLGVEVLLLHDRIDEWVVSSLTEFDGHPLKSAARGDLDLGALGAAPEKEAEAAKEGEFAVTVTRMQEALRDRASAVRLTHRLTDSPACLVSEEGGLSLNLERLLKASGRDVPTARPVLEINPEHPLVRRLKAENNEATFGDWSQVLFDQAVLAEGGQLDDPAAFVRRLNTLTLALAGEAAPRIWTPGQ